MRKEIIFIIFITLGAVRVGFIDNEVVVNPNRRDLKNSLLNMIITSTVDKKVGEYHMNINYIICFYQSDIVTFKHFIIIFLIE